jgi:hypothetical protein
VSVSLSPTLLAVQAAARMEATRQLLAGGFVACMPAPRPADGDEALYPALARIQFSARVGLILDDALQIDAPIEGQCMQAGLIAWARIETADGAWVLDCDAADLNLDITQIYPGAFVKLLSGVFR